MTNPDFDILVSDVPEDEAPAPRRERRGFALPLAILVIAVLTVILAAGFASTATEILTNNAQRSEARAFALAENGLQEFVARRAQGGAAAWCDSCGSPPTVKYESTTVSLPGGYAQVVAHRVMKNVGVKRTAVYLIRSRGVDTITPLLGSLNGSARNIRAERIVAQYAYWDMKVINIVSGWTSLSGLKINGGAATISGADHCAANPTIAGVATPTGGYDAKDGIATGSPDNLELGTVAQAAAKTNIDWLGLRNETAITPDLTLAGGGTAPVNFFNNPLFWPIVHVKGDYNITGGHGMLIIDGNATFSGNGTWNGIVLVGGNLTSNGNNSLYGAVITGLNVKLGMAVAADDAGNGNKFYQYDSCSVAAATAGIGHYRLYPNAWMDNFTTY
jgi:hypothetical protein